MDDSANTRRGKALQTIINTIDDLNQRKILPAEESNILANAFSILTEFPLPGEYREVLGSLGLDPNHRRTRTLMRAKDALTPSLEAIHFLLHFVRLLEEGEKWTIMLQSECGFTGSVVLAVDALGSCEERVNASLLDSAPGEVIH